MSNLNVTITGIIDKIENHIDINNAKMDWQEVFIKIDYDDGLVFPVFCGEIIFTESDINKRIEMEACLNIIGDKYIWLKMVTQYNNAAK